LNRKASTDLEKMSSKKLDGTQLYNNMNLIYGLPELQGKLWIGIILYNAYLFLLTSSPNRLKLLRFNQDTYNLAGKLNNLWLPCTFTVIKAQTSPVHLWQLFVKYLALSRPVHVHTIHRVMDRWSALIELWRLCLLKKSVIISVARITTFQDCYTEQLYTRQLALALSKLLLDILFHFQLMCF